MLARRPGGARGTRGPEGGAAGAGIRAPGGKTGIPGWACAWPRGAGGEVGGGWCCGSTELAPEDPKASCARPSGPAGLGALG